VQVWTGMIARTFFKKVNLLARLLTQRAGPAGRRSREIDRRGRSNGLCFKSDGYDGEPP